MMAFTPHFIHSVTGDFEALISLSPSPVTSPNENHRKSHVERSINRYLLPSTVPTYDVFCANGTCCYPLWGHFLVIVASYGKRRAPTLRHLTPQELKQGRVLGIIEPLQFLQGFRNIRLHNVKVGMRTSCIQ